MPSSPEVGTGTDPLLPGKGRTDRFTRSTEVSMPNPIPTPHHASHPEVAMPWASGFVLLGVVLSVLLALRVLLQ